MKSTLLASFKFSHHSRWWRRLLIGMLASTFVCGFAGPANAFFVTWVQAQANNGYHYGCYAEIYVTRSPYIADGQKVVSIVATRDDETADVEIGHSWVYGQPVQNFYAALTGGVEHEYAEGCPPISEGTTVSYNVGYDPPSNRHRIWFNSTLWPQQLYVPEMTTCVPETNAEREWWDDPYGSNKADFYNLFYKNYNWGSWSPWPGPQFRYDNDPRWSNLFPYDIPNHVQVVNW